MYRGSSAKGGMKGIKWFIEHPFQRSSSNALCISKRSQQFERSHFSVSLDRKPHFLQSVRTVNGFLQQFFPIFQVRPILFKLDLPLFTHDAHVYPELCQTQICVIGPRTHTVFAPSCEHSVWFFHASRH